MKKLKLILFFLFFFTHIFSQTGKSKITNEILKTDSLFAARSLEIGAKKAFAEFLHPSAIELSQKKEIVQGAQNIVESFGNFDDNLILEWKPQDGEISECKTMAWSWGIYYVKLKKNEETIKKGKYLNIWRKDTSGKWKVKVDIGNQTKE